MTNCLKVLKKLKETRNKIGRRDSCGQSSQCPQDICITHLPHCHDMTKATLQRKALFGSQIQSIQSLVSGRYSNSHQELAENQERVKSGYSFKDVFSDHVFLQCHILLLPFTVSLTPSNYESIKGLTPFIHQSHSDRIISGPWSPS